MTDIRDKVNATLSEVYQNYYCGFPEFGEGCEPEQYATYFVTEKTEFFASGDYKAKKYWISVSIITRGYNQTLYDSTENAFTGAGFTYCGANDVSSYESGSTSPHRYQYTQEYIISAEK